MNYKKIEIDNFNIHLIKTDNFKTISVRVNFKRKMDKKDLTIRRMLTQALFQASKTYPSNRELEKELEELYGAKLGVNNVMSGNYDIIQFTETFLNEKYTEKGINKKSLEFLLDVILNPNIKNDAFSDYNFDLAKRNMNNCIKSFKEDLYEYSVTRMFENMDKKSSVSFRWCGYKKDLSKITKSNLYEYYKSVIENDTIDICIVGDIDETLLIDVFKNKIKNNKTLSNLSHYQINNEVRKKPIEIIEKEKIEQSKLVIGYNFTDLTDFELKYVLNILSFILGGSGESLLFKVVREENSLCYNINSEYILLNGFLYIYCGIDSKNYKKTVKLIKEVIEHVKQGNFDDIELENAKTTYKNGCIKLFDSPNNLMSLYLGHEYLDLDLIDKKQEMIKKVTKEDVINLSNKMYMNTIYLLKGEQHEKSN